MNHPGNRLSGGEQQMLAVGRGLMTNPDLLLVDEPTEGLSPIFVETVGQDIRKLQESGMSILLVEQNLRFACRYTDYIHILNRGQIVHSSKPDELRGKNGDHPEVPGDVEVSRRFQCRASYRKDRTEHGSRQNHLWRLRPK